MKIEIIKKRINSTNNGFTLVELLVTIVMIAILVGISFMGVKRLVNSANLSKSVSNLRQIHSYAEMYSSDNNAIIVPAKSRSGQQWQIELIRYSMIEYEGIWKFLNPDGTYKDEVKTFIAPGWTKSPAYDRSRFWQTGYGLNLQPGLPSNQTSNTQENWGNTYRKSQITAISKRAYILQWPEWNAVYRLAAPKQAAYLNNKIPVLFFDGHVETVTPEEVRGTLIISLALDRAE